MLFNSIVFLVFLVGFFAVWPLVRARHNLRWTYITLCSFFFYGWWNWRYTFLLFYSGTVDYFVGLGIGRYPRLKKPFLVLSLLSNIGILCTFKYLGFFTANLSAALQALHLGRIPVIHLVLPIGISFYTFQSLSYTIDVYKGKLAPEKNFLHFFAFLSMFPQLVAGPIVRAYDLLPQLSHYKTTTERERWSGFELIMFGYFKKVVVADNLAPVINEAFKTWHLHGSGAFWWIIMVMFSFQIYCDFSGYSDIARGLARWMGYEYPLNFDHPYIATSIRDFWTRWHISLSTWFRDYVYFPLGGSRRGARWGHLNMWVTMVVSGFWHGAAWTFLIWGALHAFYLSLERVTEWPTRLMRLPGGRHLCIVVVFLLALVAWVFFRAPTFGQAIHVTSLMFNFGRWDWAAARELVWSRQMFLVALMAARHLYFHGRNARAQAGTQGAVATWIPWALQPAMVGLLIAACVFFRGPGSAFIYFQF